MSVRSKTSPASTHAAMRLRVPPVLLHVLLLAASIAIAFALKHDYINQSHVIDDDWLTAKGPITIQRVLLSFYPPHLQWFYRPAFVVYWMVLNTVAPKQWPLLHGVGIVYFGITAYLAGVVAHRLTGRPWLGVAVGAAYLFLTQQEEVMTFISDQSTSLVAIYSLLAILCWLRAIDAGNSVQGDGAVWRVGRGRGWYIAGTLVCIWAMLTKEDSCGLPFILCAVELARRGWTGRRMLTKYVPLIAWMPIYFLLSLDSYRHQPPEHFKLAVNHSVTATLRFAGIHTVHAYFASPGTSILIPMTVLGAIAIAWRLRRSPELLAMLAAMFITVLPIGAAIGTVALVKDRFHYVSDVYATIFWVTVVWLGVLSKRRVTQLAAILAVASRQLPPLWDLSVTTIVVPLLIPVLGLLIWRYPKSRDIAIPLLVAGLAAVVPMLDQQSDLGMLAVATMGISAAGLFAAGKRNEDLFDGVVFAMIASVSLPIALVVVPLDLIVRRIATARSAGVRLERAA